jgi:hypothetical protein
MYIHECMYVAMGVWVWHAGGYVCVSIWIYVLECRPVSIAPKFESMQNNISHIHIEFLILHHTIGIPSKLNSRRISPFLF